MTIYACITGGVVLAQLSVVDPPDGVGPPLPSGVDDDYDQVVIIPELIRRTSGMSDTTLLTWNDGDPTWVETATPAEITEAVWGRIKDKRDSVKRGGVQVGTHWFHSDDSSRIQQLGLKDQARDMLAAGGAVTDTLYKLGAAILWKTMSGAFVPMTVQLAIDIVVAVGDADAKSFAVAEQHRATMEASSNPSAYDFSAGWPEVYADTLLP